jgi:hypothetical protein
LATVTGILTDFLNVPLAAFSPEIWFTPSGPAISNAANTALFSTKPIVVIPAADGTFTVNLQSTDFLQPSVWYMVSVRWLDSVGGYVGIDFIDWQLFVPTAGGAIGGIIAAPSNPAQVWVGETPPANPTPGTWWLIPSTSDLFEWSN